MITETKELGTYLENFTDFEKLSAGRNLPWLRRLRADAFARFYEAGFPTTHDEDWRFTNVSSIARTPFQLSRNGHITKPEVERIEGAACQLVFINGRLLREFSSVNNLSTGVEACGLAAKINTQPQALEVHLGQYLNTQRDAFAALNTAFLEDGAYVHINKGVVLEQPIYLLFISIASDSPIMSHPRNLIVAEQESQATIVEEYLSLGEHASFCNTVTELVAGDNAVISHYRIEREHEKASNISTLRIQQGRSANIASHSILLGGALVRNNVHPVLAGEGSECLVNGLFIGKDRQHLDNYMLVEHASPHCASRQFYNGILDDRSHGVFHGRIIVHKDAQKTDAKQTNRNLLLSDDAQIDTKPQLEIYADDVKCTHGATIGQIEENALFYLRSRGIDEVSARKLLLFAFASECLDRMKQGPVRDRLEGLIHRYLTQVAGSVNELTTASSREDAGKNLEEIG